MASSMSTSASTSSSSSTFLDGTEPYFPILLSCLAGASTCVGAGIVFWLDPIQIRKSMSFALSLAGSVMITVSVVSIGPECWEDITTWGMFGKRLVSFLVGCMSYYALSKYLFPEPPETLFLIQQVSQDNPENANAPMDAKRKTWNPPFPDDKNDDGDDGQMKKEHDRPQDKLNAIIRTHDMEPSKTMSLNCDHSKPRSNNNKMKLDQTMTPRFRRTNTHPNPTTTTTMTTTLDGNTVTTINTTMITNGANLSRVSSKSSIMDEENPTMEFQNQQEELAVLLVQDNDTALANDKIDYYNSSKEKKKNKSMVSTLWGNTHSWSSGSDLTTFEAKRSWRVALLLFISLLCHNFPEGLAVVASTVESRHLGMTVALGIFVHNIPEGIAIAVPCLAARPNQPWLAFWLASLSGLAEPCGAWLAWMVLYNEGPSSSSSSSILSSSSLGNILACVAGIMIMVALIELYPEAWRHQQQIQQKYGIHSIVAGTLVGMAIMIATEWYID